MTADSSENLLAELLGRTSLSSEPGPLEIACSGGADSSALALLGAATNRPLTLHHVDHGLRPSSAAEAEHVAAFADAIGANFVGHRVEFDDRGNLEESARLARRNVLPRNVATGHTMDDQAETLLINLLRGTGPSGLGSLAPGPTHPIVMLRRHETHRLCEEMGVDVVVDESNSDPSIQRNEIRRLLVPLLAEISGRDPIPLLARLAGIAREESLLLDELASLVITDPRDVRDLRDVPAPLAARALRRWITDERSTDGLAHPPTSAEIGRVMAVVRGEVRSTELSGGHRLLRTEGRLRIE